jgi:N-acetylglucosaminyl-diphospho-decaprenol L-rhamnosyltransferase
LTPQVNPEEEKKTPRVSVVVVCHNQSSALEVCLESIEGSEGRPDYQVIVIDNGSTDGAVQLEDRFPTLQWIKLPKNFGLTKAWNIGWRAADAPYVLFLHADTKLQPDAVRRLAEALDDHNEAVAVCPLLVDAEGQPAPQLGTFPPNGKWRPAAVTGESPFAVEYPRGAAWMVRVFYIKAIRQIDEHYGQFGADADLAMQIRRAGRKILLVPKARAYHQGRLAYPAIERADWLLGRAVFLGKYQGFGAGLSARLAAVFGPLVRFQFGVLRYTLANQKIDGTQA